MKIDFQNRIYYFDEKSYNLKVGRFLNRLVSDVGFTREEICSALSIREPSLTEVLLARKSLTAKQFIRLSESLHFSLDSFDADQVDLSALREIYRGNRGYLRNEFESGARSRIRSIRNVIHFVQKNYGHSFADMAFSYFNFTEESYRNPERLISVNFLESLLQFFRERGLDNTDILKIGLNAVDEALESSFGQQMTRFRSPGELYENYLGDLIRLVEANNEYVITQLRGDMMVVESRVPQAILDENRGHEPGGVNRCLYRVGALMAATRFIGLPDSTVHESTCVHRGAHVCTFVIDFGYPSRVAKRQRSRCGH